MFIKLIHFRAKFNFKGCITLINYIEKSENIV